MSLWSWITGRRGYRDAPDEPAATGGPPATVDSQDPLPEAQWFWRRCFIFVTTAVIIVGIWLMVQSIRDVTGDEPQLAVGAFVKIIGWMLLFQWFTSTYYLIAPSAEQVTRMWQTANLLKSGLGFSSEKTATGPDGSTASTQTKVGTGGNTPPAVAPAEPAFMASGLPGIAGNDPPDPLDDAPPANPDLPEEPSWRA
jgi:hypothetical protein